MLPHCSLIVSDPPGHLIYAADAGAVSTRVEPEEVYRMYSHGF